MIRSDSVTNSRVVFVGARALVFAMALVACSGSRKNDTAEDAAKTDSPTADPSMSMPGMDMSKTKASAEASDEPNTSEVTFTAVQVKNGNVRWQAATMDRAQASAIVPGVLMPNEDRTARLGSPASGRVLAVHVSPGDRVTRGQVLVTLASPAAGAAQADVAKAIAGQTAARAQAAYAVSARERAARLLELKAIPRQDYERAVADEAQSQASLTQANAEVSRAQSTAAQLGGDGSANGEIAVRATSAGVVLSRSAVPGAVVDMGTPLIIVTDPSTLWLNINAPESLVAAFKRGGELRFTVPAFAGEQFVARVQSIGAGLDASTRTLAVRALVSNAAATGRLRSEMLANVVVSGGPTVPAVILPADAVQTLNGKFVVFVATLENTGGARFVVREVETGSRANGRIAVTKGLTAGELVVVAGAFRVKAQLQNGSMPEMEM